MESALPDSEMQVSVDDDSVVIVSIEGGIGVGKSTVMDAAERRVWCSSTSR